jgi:hypothetical protein
MTLRTLRAARTTAPRHARRRPLEAPDATTCADPAPPPEPVFDRVTGPYARRVTEEP